FSESIVSPGRVKGQSHPQRSPHSCRAVSRVQHVWRPGQYAAYRELETPFEDVPQHLVAPLQRWMSPFLSQSEHLERFAIDTRVSLPYDPYDHPRATWEEILAALGGDPEVLLNAVEWALRVFPNMAEPARELDHLL